MDLLPYLLRLALLLPLICGLIVGALWLAKRLPGFQAGLAGGARSVRMLEALPVGQGVRLMLVEFEGRRLLLSVARGGAALVAEGAGEGGDSADA